MNKITNLYFIYRSADSPLLCNTTYNLIFNGRWTQTCIIKCLRLVCWCLQIRFSVIHSSDISDFYSWFSVPIFSTDFQFYLLVQIFSIILQWFQCRFLMIYSSNLQWFSVPIFSSEFQFRFSFSMFSDIQFALERVWITCWIPDYLVDVPFHLHLLLSFWY